MYDARAFCKKGRGNCFCCSKIVGFLFIGRIVVCWYASSSKRIITCVFSCAMSSESFHHSTPYTLSILRARILVGQETPPQAVAYEGFLH